MFVLYTAQGTRVIFKHTSLKDRSFLLFLLLHRTSLCGCEPSLLYMGVWVFSSILLLQILLQYFFSKISRYILRFTPRSGISGSKGVCVCSFIGCAKFPSLGGPCFIPASSAWANHIPHSCASLVCSEALSISIIY